ncbi:hypothetical protein FE257_005940 [Aspergillus nanangensis]|uniref:Uncharacterized protein n=1 Tax=Aspergillus nanangensis TaxID=2582783 RepID=A0AAD4CPX7_ASPNN|nr:hypothetical protein FE257_005940 [Aspergillus nanangensis]
MDKDHPSPSLLFRELESLLPPDFPEGTWYIIVASCLISIGRGDVDGDLCNYIKQKPGTDNKEVLNRLRKVIIKSWALVGMPKAISASYSLQQVDPDGDVFDEHHRASTMSNTNALWGTSQNWF